MDRSSPTNLLAFAFWLKLCDTLILTQELPLEVEERQAAIRATAQFVAGQTACLPIVLRILTTLGLLGFQFIVFLKYGKSFVDLPAAAREREVEQWSGLSLIPLSKLLLAIRSLCLLHFFEQPSVQAALDKM